VCFVSSWLVFVFFGGADAALAQPAPLTYRQDIAPIVAAHCAGCHRTGEVAPFELLTYQDVRQRATLIADVTARRVMPPWKPDPAGPRFLDSRALTDNQIHVIQEWVKQGAREGDGTAPVPARKEGPATWQLGSPDLIVSMAMPYAVAADGPDVFRTFVLPIPNTVRKYVRALEFHPGNARVVHHANLGVDRSQASRRLDEQDPLPGYSGGIVSAADDPQGQMLGWTPGQRPRPAPDGTQWRLDPGSDLVVQLHLQPSGKPEAVQASVGLFFADAPPSRTPVGIRLGSERIDIAAGDTNYVVSDSYTLPVDAELIAIQPHAHNLARRMTAIVTRPDGTKQPLISIADWDFRWQEIYRYAQAVPLPKGTTVTMRYTYDNSIANARNPHRPPARVTWGQNTTNEMGDLWLQVIPKSPGDLPALAENVSRKMRAEDLAANLVLLNADPNDPAKHDTVGIFYLQSGQLDQAMSHLRESLKLKPESAPTHYNLGLAYLAARRPVDAASELREALRIDPGHADAHNSLGAAYQVQGQQRAAAEEYRRAAALRSDQIGARTNLAWLLAASSDEELRDATEAVRVAEEAAAVTHHDDASVLDALAASYASARQFDRAIATANDAVRLANDAGQTLLVTQITQRRALYERGLPYRLQ